jgi:hypothetical protein
MHLIIQLGIALIVVEIVVYGIMYVESIPYANKCRDLAPANYTFLYNQFGICTYESDSSVAYNKCTQDIIDTENHGTIIGSSTCNRSSFTFS